MRYILINPDVRNCFSVSVYYYPSMHEVNYYRRRKNFPLLEEHDYCIGAWKLKKINHEQI